MTVVAQPCYIVSMKDAVVRARVSETLKSDTEKVFSELGITTTEAIRMFLAQVRIHRGLPFKVQTRRDANELLRSNDNRQSSLDEFYDD